MARKERPFVRNARLIGRLILWARRMPCQKQVPGPKRDLKCKKSRPCAPCAARQLMKETFATVILKGTCVALTEENYDELARSQW